MRVLLHIRNPVDVDVSLQLTPVLPKNARGDEIYNAVCAFGSAGAVEGDTATKVQLLAFDDMATGDELVPEEVAKVSFLQLFLSLIY